MGKEKSYEIGTIAIVVVLIIIFIYFIPVNFLKFITWLGKNEYSNMTIDKNSCIVLAKFVD